MPAEYDLLDAEPGEVWAAKDKDLDQKRTELKKKYGAPPHILQINTLLSRTDILRKLL